MFSRRRHDTHTETETVKGPSLARGPAWIVGLVLSIAGLALFFRAPGSPLSTAGFPDGVASGDTLLGFEANAWTAWLTTAAGIAVLIGAAQHLAARTLSLIVGLALGAMAVIALFDGDDVLGLAAANGLTALGWGIAAAVLLITALLPRARRERPVRTTDQHTGHDHDRDRIAERDRARIAEREHARASAAERQSDRTSGADRDRVATPTAAAPATSHDDHATTRDGSTTVQPAATTSDERASGTPPVRSAGLRHTYEPRTTDDEQTVADPGRQQTRR